MRPPPPWWSASARRGSPAGLRRSPDEHGPRPAFRLHDASWLHDASRLRDAFRIYASRLRFAHFFLLAYAPGRSVIVIALDLFVIWAPAAYRDPGRAPGDARRRP
ncbi:hypothetical protein CIB93_15205 [Streptomyces sp. WZ.A104]|nr:hypothetical protein CIB93_15205 [Streptomyces sp. WZ.A104]